MKSRTIKKLRNKVVLVVGGLLVMLTCFACHPTEVYYQFNEIKNAEWNREETFSFEVDSTLFELNTPYEITIEVTNNVNYPYRNIWFYVTHDLDDASRETRVQFEYYLADEQGRWLGAGFGSLYQMSLILKKNYVFKENRNYTFSISQDMKDNPLLGVERIGIRVNKINK